MDVDIVQRQVTELMAWKARAEPMLDAMKARIGAERIGAKLPPLTEAQHAAHASAVRAHAENISRLVSTPARK
jgi:hypothetical protein